MYCMDTMLLATKYISFVTGYEHPIWIITSFYSYYSSNTYYIHHARDFQQYYVCMYVL